MRVAITGSSGMIGSALARSLAGDGHTVLRLVRRAPSPGSDEIRWDPARGEIDRGALEGTDAVVNLAGESIASGRWTGRRMRAISESRVKGTRLLAEALASLSSKPHVLVSASGINYYGNRGDELLTESSSAAAGFLARVCREWEEAAEPARAAGIRLAVSRTGLVLSGRGGALAKMLPVFRAGLGGPIGNGMQYMSCISLEDLVRALRFLIEDGRLSGPVNAVLPAPVRNKEFVRALGRALGRPAILPVPAPVISLLFGAMGRETLLASLRVVPEKLLAAGFRFHHDTTETALRAALGR
jgi:hypothetical protein